MTILAIARNFNGDPNIVTMVTDNTIAELTTSGYFTSDDSVAEVEALNNGPFETADTDLWLIYASDGISFYTYNTSTGAFVANPPASGISSTLPDGEILVGSALNVATPVAMSGDVAISNAGVTTIQPGAIDLAMLSAGITPSDIVKFADQVTTAGGAAAEAFTVTGAAATDLAFVQVVDNGTNNVTVLQAVVTLNTLTVTFSADPGNDCIINYQLLRAAS